MAYSTLVPYASGVTHARPFAVGDEWRAVEHAELVADNLDDHEARVLALEAVDASKVTGPSASVASEIALYDGTTGKLIKRATGTGYAKVVSGVLQTPATTVPLATDVSGNLPLANLPTNFAQIFKATVTLTDAQVKALPTTAITVVAAPGSGFYIALLGAEVFSKFASGAYTNLNATYCAIGLQLGTGLASGAAPSMLIAKDSGQSPAMTLLTTFLSASSRRTHLGPYMESNPAYVNPGAADGSYAIDLAADVDNKALTISADNNGSGNFTGGNAANTLRVVAYYTIETVP